MPIKKKIITDINIIEEYINQCEVCYVGMSLNDQPYTLPFNFGFRDNILYLHGSKEGKKIEILKANNRVCVAFDAERKLFVRNEPVACSYSMLYKSVLLTGKAYFVEDYDGKVEGINIIMQHYAHREFKYSKPAIDNIAVIRVVADEIVGHHRDNF